MAAVLAAAASASAQTINTNIFGGTNAPNPDALSVPGQALNSNNTAGPFGPSYNGTLTIGAGVGATLSETMNPNGNGVYTISNAGLAGVSGSFTSSKSFAGSSFAANQYYQLTLTRSTASAISALSSLNVQLATTNNGNTTVVLDTSTGTGSTLSLLTAFGAGNTATITFLTPSNVPTTSPITVSFSGGVTASVVGSAFAFTGGSLQAVPEPGPCAAVALGTLGLAFVIRRRLA